MPAASLESKTSTIESEKNTDFVVDPFADYRYEDVFSIKDPFDEDQEGELILIAFF